MGGDSNEEEYGHPKKFDPNFKGPLDNRSCTDIICCVLFTILFIGMILVGIVAFAKGDPRLLLYPTDSEGNLCGYGDFENKPNLFFFDLMDCGKLGPAVVINGCPTPQVCVEECPGKYFEWYSLYITDQIPGQSADRSDMICLYDVNPSTSSEICIDKCPDSYFTWVEATISDAKRQEMICKHGVDPESKTQICVQRCPVENFVWYQTLTDSSAMDKMICKHGINLSTTHFEVCVGQCPDHTMWAYQAVYDPTLKDDLICRNGTDMTKSVKELVEDQKCAAYYVDSKPVLGRCFPSIFEDGFDILDQVVSGNDPVQDRFGNNVTKGVLQEGSQAVADLLNAKEYGLKIYQDVRATWWMMLIGLGAAMVLSFIWIILMRWLAFFMVWLTILLFVAIFAFATYYCLDKYFDMKDDPNHQLVGDIAITTDLDYYTNLADTWLALGIIAGVLLLIILLVLLFLRTRILIAIALIKETSKAVGNMVFTLFWPIIPFFFQLFLFAYWGAAAIFLASMGTGQYRNANSTNITLNGSDLAAFEEYQAQVGELLEEVPCDPDGEDVIGDACSFLKYGDDKYTMYLQIFMLFMLFWVMNFIVALSQMVLAGAFASYYWAFRKPNDIPAFPVTASAGRAFRYHLGTIAFGSLIIAIIQMIRVALEYIDQKLKGSENKVAQYAVKCLKCCFWCLEKIIKFINKNAYILTAVYGYNFCTAAKNAFMLIMRNIVRVAVVDKVTDFIIFIGKLMVVGAIGLLSFGFFSGDLAKQIPIQKISDYIDDYTPELNYYLVPVIIICIGSYVIASCFFSVYNMGVDTLFLCFLEDLERHDGSTQKPYYMSKSLMKILGKKNDPAVEQARRRK